MMREMGNRPGSNRAAGESLLVEAGTSEHKIPQAQTSVKPDPATCLRALRLINPEPGAVVELRVPKAIPPGYRRPHVEAGYFDDFDRLAAEACRLSPWAPNVYMTINRLSRDLLARADNRVRVPDTGESTSDAADNVIRRTHILIDVDASRLSNISATDEEHDRALALLTTIVAFMHQQGWPRPLLVDSGNGGHALYGVDLPNDDKGLTQRFLAALAAMFDTEKVHVDTSVYNPSRVCKLPGTLARKGDSTQERPHRLSRIIEAPDALAVVPTELIEATTAALEAAKPKDAKDHAVIAGPERHNGDAHGWLDAWIPEFCPEAGESVSWKDGRKWLLTSCPNGHTDHAAVITQNADGTMGYNCSHHSCQYMHWREFRALKEAGRKMPTVIGNRTAKSPGSTERNSSHSSYSSYSSAACPSANGVICMADVARKPVTWLWPQRIPLGKLTIIDGDPGLGKSILTLTIAARVTRGATLPGDSIGDLSEPAGVVLLSAEDDLGDTIRPRLDAAGADASRVFVLAHTGIDGDLASIPESIPTIEGLILAKGAKLVVIDPLMAFLSKDVKSHVDQDVRRALAALKGMAERTGAAVVLVRHLNKLMGPNPLYRGGGSIGIIGAARSGMMVAPDPNDPEGRMMVLASTKSNLSEPGVSLQFRVETTPDGAARIAWAGTSTHTAKSLCAPPKDDRPRESEQFLRDALKDGPRASADLMKEAKEAGITRGAMFRAKKHLGVKARKAGFGDGWEWSLAEASKETAQEYEEYEEYEEYKACKGELFADKTADEEHPNEAGPCIVCGADGYEVDHGQWYCKPHSPWGRTADPSHQGAAR